MRCPSSERLTAILQGTEPSEPALDAHIAACPTCNAVVAHNAALQLGTTFTTENSSLGGPAGESRIGDPSARYEVLSVVSRGGLGIVLRARDRLLGRVVALKQMLVRDPRLAARFSREALLTARLQHPSIVPLYEAGRATNGEPFYVMKLVAGKTFADRILEAPDFPSRLALMPHMLAVADAIAYAHGERVIHRDLKPNNVMVGDFGETVVVDWGLGKRLDVDDAIDASDATSQPAGEGTVDGVILGTPRYMAPEQAAGVEADERADVYAIGAMIYTLLSGVPPFAKLDPKAAVVAARDQSPTPIDELEPKTPPDLAALVRKAMTIDPAQRYPTARELRDELRRFLAGQLVRAHDYSTWQRVRRFIAAHRAAVLSSALLLFGLAIMGALSVHRIERERRDAESARREAEGRRDQLALAQARAALGTDPTTTLAWLKTYPPTRDWRAARRIADEALASTPARHVFRDARAAQLSHRGDHVAITRGRTVEICALSSGECRVLSQDGPELNDVAFSPDDETVVGSGGEPSVVRRWDVASGAQTTLPGLGATERSGVLYFSPDGTQLLVFNHSRAVLLDRATMKTWTLDAKQNGALFNAAFSPDGKRLAVTNQAQPGVRVWDLGAGNAGNSVVLGEHAPLGAVPIFLDQGRRLLVAFETTQTIEEWDLEQNVLVRRLVGNKDDVIQLAASADGRVLLSGDNSGQVRIWQLASGASRVLGDLRGSVMAANLSPDATWAAAASTDGVIALWHLPTGDRLELRGHGDIVEQLQFSSDGRRLLSRGTDRSARIWDLPRPRRIVVEMGRSTHASAAYSPDGKHIAWARGDGIVHVCDEKGGACNPLAPAVPKPQWVEYAADGRLFVSGSSGRIWDASLTTSKELWRDQVMLATLSPDGRHVVAPGAASPALYLFDGVSGERVATYPCGVHVQAGFVAANGSRVAYGDERGFVRWADLPNGAPHELTIGADLQVPNVALSRDGKTLVASGEDGGVRLWDLPNETPRLLGKHSSPSQPIAISPDGQTVASGGWDQTVRFFSIATGREVIGRGHHAPVLYLQFSPDGKVVATGSEDGGVGMWNVETGAGRVVLAHTPRSVRGVSFSPDGRQVVSTGEDGTLQIWDVVLPDDNLAPTSLLAAIESATSVILDAQDRPATGARVNSRK